MTRSPTPLDEFRGLLGQLAERSLSPTELQRFNELLSDDVGALDLFVDDAMLDVCLEMSKGTEEDWLGDRWANLALGQADQTGQTDQASQAGAPVRPVELVPEFVIVHDPVPIPPPVRGVFGHATHGLIDYFSQLGPFSYLMATFIMLFVGVVAWNVEVSVSPEIVRQAPSPITGESSGDRRVFEVVGRVTSMIDCRWSDPNTETASGAQIPLGRKYALAAGMMEISYATGAKVVLQGPCNYEVESTTGGFLSIGKLTATVEKSPRSKVQGPGTAVSSPQSLIPNPLFTVRTPTATVTDLGTEFGVEVEETGVTSTHVFRGEVEVCQIARRGKPGIRLTENESARVGASNGGEAATVEQGTADCAAFVRVGQIAKLSEERRLEPFHRWQAYSEKLRADAALVAYYDFQRRDESPEVLHGVGSAAEGALNGAIKGAVWTKGHMPGKQALYFDGDQACVEIDAPQRLTQVTLAAWIAIEFISDSDGVGSAGLLMPGGWANEPGVAENCHWQIVRSGQICLSTPTCGRWITEPLLPWQKWGRDRWRHLAVVADPSNRRVTFYLDGQAAFTDSLQENFAATFGSARIGNWQPVSGHMARPFQGRMDELVILGRAMTEQEILEMYKVGAK